MKSAAVAVAVALALCGCLAEEWSFDVQGATLDDASVRVESGPDVPMAAHCLGDMDCVQPAPRCDVQSGKCVGCLSDADCTQSFPRCDVHLGKATCVVCIDDRDCTVPGKPHCHPFHIGCYECVAPTDCPSGGPDTVPVCDVTQCFFSCVDGGGGTCPDRAPKCNPLRSGGRCAQCLSNTDCADAAFGSQQCGMNGSCVEGIPSTGLPVSDGGGVPDSSDAAVEPLDAASDTLSRGDAMDGSD